MNGICTITDAKQAAWTLMHLSYNVLDVEVFGSCSPNREEKGNDIDLLLLVCPRIFNPFFDTLLDGYRNKEDRRQEVRRLLGITGQLDLDIFHGLYPQQLDLFMLPLTWRSEVKDLKNRLATNFPSHRAEEELLSFDNLLRDAVSLS